VGDFYYKIILINKFIKYNQINDPCFDIKYIGLYLSLYSSNFFFIVNDFFIHLFTQWFLIYLNGCIHKFFDLHLRVFLCKKMHWEILCVQFFIIYWYFQFNPYTFVFFLQPFMYCSMFHFLGIGLNDLFLYSAFILITRVTGLKN